MSKQYRDPRSVFSLSMPDDWEYSVQSQSVAFFHPNGVGALNVSTLRPPKGVVPRPESVILNFVSKSALESGLVHVAALSSAEPSIRIAHTEYCEGNDAWRFWAIATDSVVVALSYNCKVPSQGTEDLIVDEIITSVRFP